MDNKIDTEKLKEISKEELENIDGTTSIPIIKSSNKEKHTLIETFKDMYKYLTTRKSDELFQLVWRLVLIALVIIVMYVPVQFLRDLGSEMLISFGVEFNGKTLDTYNSIWGILYSIVGILVFFKLVKTRFYNLVNMKEINK